MLKRPYPGDSPLRSARSARGWSQAYVIHKIEDFARRHVLSIASAASLRVYMSEWENGRRKVSEPYRSALRTIYGLTDHELFSVRDGETVGSTEDDLVARIEAAHVVDRRLIVALMEQTETLRNIDRALGASALLDQLEAHVINLIRLQKHTMLPESRSSIGRALAGAATLSAWLALDSGAVDRAWDRYALARSSASEAADLAHLVHCMGEQAFVLSDAGKWHLSVELSDAAVRRAGANVSPRIRAWLYACNAEFNALCGREKECRRALETADRVLPRDTEVRDPDLPSIFLDRHHLVRWRGHTLAMLGDSAAIDALEESVRTIDSTFTRAEASLRCDLAYAYLACGELSEARAEVERARHLANRTGSVRVYRRLSRLRLASA